MLLLRLAWRNLARNRRRTAITVLAVAGGLGLMVTTNNFAFGMYQEMIETSVGTMAGDVVVQAAGYQADKDQEILVADASAVRTALESARPDAVVTTRIFADALLTSPTGSVGVALAGVVPDAERHVSMWRDKLTEGEWLGTDDRALLLGAAAARSLGVELGDKVVAMAQSNGEVSSRMFRVRGIVQTGSAEIDGAFAMGTLAATQALLGRPDAAHQLALHLPDAEGTADDAHAIADALARDDVEVLDWKRAMPEMVESIALDAGSSNLMMLVIGIIVGMGVLNTVLMSVLERVREFGVMRAVGLPDRSVRRLVLAEGLLLGVCAVALGDLLGLGLSWPLMHFGVDLSSMAGEQISWGGASSSTFVHARLDWNRLWWFSVAGVGMTILASLYPAHKASHLSPVDTLRHV